MNRNRFQKFTEEIPIGICRVDLNGSTIFANQHWCELSNLSLETILQKGWQSALNEENRTSLYQSWMDQVRLGQIFTQEYALITPAGEVKWGLGQWAPEKNSRGKTIGFIGTLADISQQHKNIRLNGNYTLQLDERVEKQTAEKAHTEDLEKQKKTEQRRENTLQISSMEWRGTFDAMRDAICILDDFFNITQCNKAYTKLVNKPVIEVIGQKCWSVFDLPDGEQPEYPDNEMLQSSKFNDTLFVYQNREYRVTFDPLKLVGDHPIGYVQIFTDITEIQKASRALIDSEKRYRLLADNTTDVIWVLDIESLMFEYISPSIMILRGYSIEEVMNQKLNEVVSPDSWKILEKDIPKRIQALLDDPTSPQIYVDEMEQPRKNGTAIWTENVTRLVLDEDTGKIKVYGVTRNITERKIVQENLVEAEERYRKLVELTPDSIVIHQDGKVVFANPATYRYLGNPTPQYLSTQSILDFAHPDSRPGIMDRIRKILVQGEEVPFVEEKMLLPDGTILFAETAAVPFLYKKRPAVLVVLRDVTSRKNIEFALKEAEKRYRGLVELSPDAIAVHQELKLVFANQVFADLIGAGTPEKVQGLNLISIVHPDDHDLVLKRYNDIMAHEKNAPLAEQKYVRLDGEIIDVEVAGSLCIYQNKPAVQIVVRNITDRKRAQEALRESESRFRAIFDQSLDPIALYTMDRHILSNPAYNLLFGYDEAELRDKSFFDLVVPSQREMITNFSTMQSANGHASSAYEACGMRKDGSEFIMEIHASVYSIHDEFYTIALIRDISERKQAENELRRLNRALKTINECEQALERATEELDLLNEICRIISQNGGYKLAWIGYIDHTNPHRLRPMAWYSTDELYYQILQTVWNDIEQLPDPTSIAANSGETVILTNSKDLSHDQFQLNAIRQYGWVSSIAIPLKSSPENKTFGVLTIYASEADAFDSGEVDLLQELSEDMVFGIRSLQARQERDLAAATLRGSEERFRTIFEQAAVGFAQIAPSGQFLRLNERFCDILGYSQEELYQMKFPEIIHPDFVQPGLTEIDKILNGESNQYITDKQYIRKDGSCVWAHLTVSALHDEKGQVVFFTAVIEDISQRKLFETALDEERSSLAQRVDERTAELKMANAELARAARLKDEFLASMSHELRTPLTSILGLTEALLKQIYGELNEKQLRSLRYLDESAHHLLSLINDILDLSKIEAGKFELEPEPVSLESICQSSLQFVKQDAHKKRIMVSHVFDEKIGLIMADSRRLKQIMVNLLGNAVKFTPEGGRVGLEVLGDQDTEQLSISIWDTGIGIDEKDFPALFQPFVQLDGRLNRNYAGTGLGLSLVQRLVNLHEGTITVKSKPGQGSRFTITIPWKKVGN
jgi:PAS domain S-box-containing protein